MNQEADPVGLLQREDGLPKGNNGTRINPWSAEVRIAHGTAAIASEAGLRGWRSISPVHKKTSAQEVRPFLQSADDIAFALHIASNPFLTTSAASSFLVVPTSVSIISARRKNSLSVVPA